MKTFKRNYLNKVSKNLGNPSAIRNLIKPIIVKIKYSYPGKRYTCKYWRTRRI